MRKSSRFITTAAAAALALLGGTAAAHASVRPAAVDRTGCTPNSTVALQPSLSLAGYPPGTDCFGFGAGSVAIWGMQALYVPSDQCVTMTSANYGTQTYGSYTEYVYNFGKITYLDVFKCIPV
ncbi:hypothetical protein [Catenulispora rubra]|uniref:hypothetical protein n=1 Tax=Catenulispora rubra TaxID=280293 RepID=UPI0018921907|nr:hypothetical protein [Catenulispora rubra]